MNSSQIRTRIDKLRADSNKYKELGEKMFKADGGTLYHFDIYVCSVLHRALNLTLGFCDLLENRNIMCAGPLLRLQIDNCLRLYAGFIVRDPHKFAMEVLEGKKISSLKDENGKLMKDYYLVDQLSLDAPWVKSVYKETSGYIHFSDKHIFNSVRALNEENREIEMKITKFDQNITDKLYNEAIDVFDSATELLMKYINGWIFTKDNPEFVQFVKDEYIKEFGRKPDSRLSWLIKEI
jgi:hypothetical protein